MTKRKREVKDETKAEAKVEKKTKSRRINTNIEEIEPMTEDSRFEFNAKTIFLTYAQVDEKKNITKEMLIDFLKTKGVLTKYAVGQERHTDGGIHFHICATFGKRFHTRNVREFDLLEQHPNIKYTGKDFGAVVCYCIKDGDFIMNGVNFFPNFDRFNQKKKDMDSWLQYCKAKHLKQHDFPVTINFPFGRDVTIEQPQLQDKRCNYIVCGPPNVGKTPAIEDAFEHWNVLKVGRVDIPFDNYTNQRIIIYDDIIPKRSDIIAASNVLKTMTPCGNTRYFDKFWEQKVRRVQIILCNKEHIPNYVSDPAFQARFFEINLYDTRTLTELFEEHKEETKKN